MHTQHALAILSIAEWLFLLGGCLVVTLYHFIMEPFRWNRFYQPADSNLRSRKGTRDALFCTALATYVLPFKLGVPLRILLLQRNGELTLHFVGVVIALDGLISLGVWSFVVVVCAWTSALHWSPPWYFWIMLLVGTIVCITALALHRAMGLRMLQRLREALSLLDQPWRRICRSATILMADVFSYGLRHALLCLLIMGDAKDMIVSAAIGIMATFAGIISGLPMGLVGYDATLVALFAVIGIHPEQALLIAVTNRALSLVSAALLGIPAAMRLGLGSTVGSIIRRIREVANARS
jgi:uncharacterized membrane protein YbhN (UPF0104 family)